MRFSIKWLQKYVDIKISPEKLAEQLTNIGLEVEELDGDIIEIAVPPNRADCLGIIGIAREVAAVNGVKFSPPVVADIKASIDAKFKLEHKNSSSCIKYCGRIVRGINNSGQSPQWLQDCLTIAGMKIISPVVDITNFVQLEYGQPVHAFDLSKVSDETVVIRNARAAESLTLLDDSTVELEADALVIADADSAMALAGIKGGKDSGVYADTKDLLLECAYFDPINIRLSSRKYKIQSDSSYRNERGIDPQMQRRAMQRMTGLILELVGGQAGEIIEVVNEKLLPKPVVLELRFARVHKILGINVPSATIKQILQNLEMQILAEDSSGLKVQVPSFRTDISLEIDLIEEITRIFGYDNIPALTTIGALKFNRQDEQHIPERQIVSCLQNRGYNQAITYSFIDSEFAKNFVAQIADDWCLANPIASNMNLMRPSLLAGLVQALEYNQKRQQARVRLFEIGLRFVGDLKNLRQVKTIAGVCTGNYLPENWAAKKRLVDFYDIKGDIQALSSAPLEFKVAADMAMHPGQSALILLGGKQIGKAGALHPRLQQLLGLPDPVFMFELDYDPIATSKVATFEQFSKYPAVRRDFALLVDKDIEYVKIESAISKFVGRLLNQAILFDLYEGKGVPEGKKSLAIGVTIQDTEMTLTDAAANDVFTKLIAGLQQEFKAVLR